MARQAPNRRPRKTGGRRPPEAELRIIGGRFRGRRLRYRTRDETRPMKHRVREAVFNLVGADAKGRHAIDLFAGTGAVGLEALSRGALSVTFVEQHVPTARLIRENTETLGVGEVADVLMTNAFLWARRDLAEGARLSSPIFNLPWLVFCCPPYDFYVTRTQAMLEMVGRVLEAAPPRSVIVVEADQRLDFLQLPLWPALEPPSDHTQPAAWDVRAYPPAVVGVLRAP